MGQVNAVLVSTDCHPERWPYSGRIVIEDCETVHIHVNNIRLEFTRAQFMELVKIFNHAADRLQQIMEPVLT